MFTTRDQVSEYLDQRLSTVILDRRCNKLSGKVVQTGDNYRDSLPKGKEGFIAKLSLGRLVDEAKSLNVRYVSEQALRDLIRVHKGLEVESKERDYLYQIETCEVRIDCFRYFGFIWPQKLIQSLYKDPAPRTGMFQDLRTLSFSKNHKDFYSTWKNLKEIKAIQLEIWMPVKDAARRIERLKVIRQEMKVIRYGT